MLKRTILLSGAVALAILAAFVGCGGEESEEAGEPSGVEGAFIAEMIPHHEMAIEMAKIATERAQHPELKRLASEIVESQRNEIETLEEIHQRLFGEPVEEASHGELGISEEQAGMNMDMAMLEDARPFDREFNDMMIAHHQGAIRMARIELEQGSDDAAKSLAQAIINAQAMEITEMNEWRTDWYGAPSPAGGVPEDGEPAPAEHEGH